MREMMNGRPERAEAGSERAACARHGVVQRTAALGVTCRHGLQLLPARRHRRQLPLLLRLCRLCSGCCCSFAAASCRCCRCLAAHLIQHLGKARLHGVAVVPNGAAAVCRQRGMPPHGCGCQQSQSWRERRRGLGCCTHAAATCGAQGTQKHQPPPASAPGTRHCTASIKHPPIMKACGMPLTPAGPISWRAAWPAASTATA